MGFFKRITDFIAKASIPIFKFDNNQLHFKLKNDSFFTYELENYDMKTRHDSYVDEAYTLNNNDIFLEYIKIAPHVSWKAQASSLFESFFKEKLNIKKLEVLELFEIGHYTLKIFKVDDSFILHIIYIYTVNSDIIIIDTKGKLYKKLLSRMNLKYKYKYSKEEKASINFNISMVKENALKKFFYAD